MDEPTCVSLFSGVGGLDEGLRRAGFRHLLMCEGGGDPNGTRGERDQYAQGVYRRAVLAARFPGVPVADDVRAVALGEPAGRVAPDGRGASDHDRGREAGAGLSGGVGDEPTRTGRRSAAGTGHAGESASGWGWLEPELRPDLLAGGFPCQDLSVAGNRAGLAGERSGLFFEFARVIDAVRPRWVLLENVPGLLSSNGGRDFGIVLGTLADLGYGLGWRVLDSRFFGVPQRRRRVFIVGARADGDPRAAAERAGEVLAVGSRCGRHPATRGEARQDVAVASLSGLGTGGPDDNDGQGGRLIAETVRSHPRPGSNSNGNLVAAPLTSGSHPNSNMPGRRKEDDENLVIAGPLGDGNDGIGRRSEDDPNPVVHEPYTFDWQAGGGGKDDSFRGKSRAWIDDKPGRARALVKNKTLAVHDAPASVRRLTPTECERLQGFPDGWTDLGGTADSKRYAALGDAVTVNVAEWIGRKIATAITQERSA